MEWLSFILISERSISVHHGGPYFFFPIKNPMDGKVASRVNFFPFLSILFWLSAKQERREEFLAHWRIIPFVLRLVPGPLSFFAKVIVVSDNS